MVFHRAATLPREGRSLPWRTSSIESRMTGRSSGWSRLRAELRVARFGLRHHDRRPLSRGIVQPAPQPVPDRGARRPRRVVLIALGALLTVTFAVGAVGSLPAACSLCHGSQSDAMAETAHGDMNCYGCHLENGLWGVAEQKTIEFTRMYPLALAGAGLRNPAAATARTECLQCHADVLDAVSSSGGISVKHRVCAPGPTCDGCHSTVAHGSAVRWAQDATMEDCVDCHERVGAATECEACHTGDRGARQRTRGPWQITHGKNWQKTHGMGDLDGCSTCHPDDFCSKCHGVAFPHPLDFGATHGAQALEDPSACAVCHKSREQFCDACHMMPMPHPEDFVRSHSSLSEDTTDPRCVRCHVESDCVACHENHVHPGGGKGVPVPWTLTPEELRP